MDRLEAMVTIERYGSPEPCSQCGHTMPSVACNVENGCPLLSLIQESEPKDDVKAVAAAIRKNLER